MTTETTLTGENNDFADAFAALQESAAAPAAVVPAAEVIDVVATEVPAVAALAAPEAAVAPAEGEVIPPVQEVAAPTAEVLPVTLSPEATRIAALEAQIATLTAVPAAPAVVAPAAPVTVAPVYTADETATIEKYQKDWPDIHAGEALVRRAEYRDLVGYIFEQVRSQLDPLVALTQTQQGRTQYTDLVQLVPDYDTVRDKTLAWVETQPEYLKRAYQEVANSGSPSDVADLIGRFKKETGYAQVATPAVAALGAKAAPAAPSLTPAAKAAVTALHVVKSVRSEPTAAADPDNFDAAFAEFAAAK